MAENYFVAYSLPTSLGCVASKFVFLFLEMRCIRLYQFVQIFQFFAEMTGQLREKRVGRKLFRCPRAAHLLRLCPFQVRFFVESIEILFVHFASMQLL